MTPSEFRIVTAFRSMHAFCNLDPLHIHKLASIASERQFEEGTVIYRAGEVGQAGGTVQCVGVGGAVELQLVLGLQESTGTVWFDDVTRTGAFEPVATSPDHLRRGLASAVILEGLRRLKRMGATLAFVGSGGEPAHSLYAAMGFKDYIISMAWEKVF